MKTLQDYRLENDLDDTASEVCPTCGHAGPTFTMVMDEDDAGFECSTCILDRERDATVVALAEAAAIAGPDWSAVKADRDRWLAKCDWTLGNDSPLDEDAQAAWRTYRQTLRDLPQAFDDPSEVVWPDEPA